MRPRHARSEWRSPRGCCSGPIASTAIAANRGPADAIFPFLDLETGERWTIRPNAGRLPWWIGVPARRPPDGGLIDHLSGLTRLRKASAGAESPDFVALWSGQAVGLNRETTAAELVERLVDETRAAIGKLAGA